MSPDIYVRALAQTLRSERSNGSERCFLPFPEVHARVCFVGAARSKALPLKGFTDLRAGILAGTMSKHPEIVWAQRSEKVFLTIELPDTKNPNVKLEPEGKLKFSAVAGAGDKKYEVELDLFGKVNVEASKISLGARQIFVVIEKEEKAWWPRLLKSEGRPPPYVKVDWNKWVDEDEENESRVDDFDLGGMGDLSNFDMGGNEADSDDEDPETLPDAGTNPVTNLEQKSGDPETVPDTEKNES